MPRKGFWRGLLNSDAGIYGGRGVGNRGGIQAEAVANHGHEHSLVITTPPLSVVVFAAES
mgnify:CR=1 FL=1